MKRREVISKMEKGFTIVGLPFLFDDYLLAIRATFPVKMVVIKYEEEGGEKDGEH